MVLVTRKKTIWILVVVLKWRPSANDFQWFYKTPEVDAKDNQKLNLGVSVAFEVHRPAIRAETSFFSLGFVKSL